MRNTILQAAFFVLISVAASAQNYEKIVVNPRDTISGYYLSVTPQTKNIKGVLVLLDGFGGSAESIFPETKLQNVAYVNDILTVAIAMGNKIYADSIVIENLNILLKDVVKRYKIQPDKFVIGGFSAGGTISLRYVERCKETPSIFPVNPRAVFAVDSPVDIIDLWHFFEKQIDKNYSAVAVNEANTVMAIMKAEHGTPESNPKTYRWLTPFDHLQNGDGNERFLKNIPVRVYHDVDIAWQLQNRRRSVYESNFLNSSELIMRLLQSGNEAAEFVVGKTGYRSSGMRHPHAWSIVDEVEFVQWMKKILE